MRFYLSLSACAPETREALLDSVEPARLLRSSEALSLFGEDLIIERGALVYPGAREAWTAIPGSPTLSLDALLSNNGAPLLLYSVLRASPAPVQKFLTDSPERLRAYFEVIKPYASTNFSSSIAAAVSQDLLRMFRMSTVTPAGLTLSLNGAMAVPLLNQIARGKTGGGDSVSLTPEILAKLLPRPGVSPYSEESRANIVEFFLHLQQTRPALLSPESVNVLMKAPAKMPVFLELMGDLEPDPILFAKYLEYCTKTDAAGSEGWNENRTRTSQSIFFLLSALYR